MEPSYDGLIISELQENNKYYLTLTLEISEIYKYNFGGFNH